MRGDKLLEAITRELAAAINPADYQRAKRRASGLDVGRQMAVIDTFKAARARILGAEDNARRCRCYACRLAAIRVVPQSLEAVG